MITRAKLDIYRRHLADPEHRSVSRQEMEIMGEDWEQIDYLRLTLSHVKAGLAAPAYARNAWNLLGELAADADVARELWESA